MVLLLIAWNGFARVSNFLVFSPLMFFGRFITLKLFIICRKCLKKMDIKQFVKRKSISDSRRVENISDKRLRIEVRPVQTNWMETVKRFVNIHLHCIVSNLKRISKISTLSPSEKTSADAHECTDFDLILRSWSVVLFGSNLLSHSKTINAKVVTFLNAVIKKLQFWRVGDSLKTWKRKECFVIQARGPLKHEAPGSYPACPVALPALVEDHLQHTLKVTYVLRPFVYFFVNVLLLEMKQFQF